MQTSIIATIGPKTNSVEKLSQLRDAGMNIGMCTFRNGVTLHFRPLHLPLFQASARLIFTAQTDSQSA
jgi:hypothetical protein